jgi:hypothetical protein
VFTVCGMVVSMGSVVSKPDGLNYDFVEFLQAGGKRTSLFNVLAKPADADVLGLYAIGEFDFDGDISASLFCGLRRADGPGMANCSDCAATAGSTACIGQTGTGIKR